LAVTKSSEAPELIEPDKFSVMKGRLFHTTICNPTNKTVMAMVEGQSKQKIEKYIENITQSNLVKMASLELHALFAMHSTLRILKKIERNLS